MINLNFSKEKFAQFTRFLNRLNPAVILVCIAIILSIFASTYSFLHGYTVAYGDAESHLNIAKRIIDSLTPGFAQMGGIWLPLPHLLMIPFVYFNPLWKTGLAGAIVSGIALVISTLYIYRLTNLITKNRLASTVGALVFMLNPNILYMQSTPMTELVLITFFILSSYYFIRFLKREVLVDLLMAAFFGFLASLSRYDGWALVLMEAGVLFLYYFPYRINLKNIFSHFAEKKRPDESAYTSVNRLTGSMIIFCAMAFLGVALWLLWGYLILGDPLYFTHSEFSAKSQQQSWLARGELPSYKNIGQSVLYYAVTSMSNVGVVVSALALFGLVYFATSKSNRFRSYTLLILFVPFLFNVATLYLGQSVIFIPSLTPYSFDWHLFNVRYGLLMVPCAAFCVAYLFSRLKTRGQITLVVLIGFQLALYGIGYSEVITLEDGLAGLSSSVSKLPDAQFWLEKNYDHGLVLTDDFARTISVIRTPIAMHDDIYIGNKPYWEESLNEPEKYARWIVMQKNDTVWRNILDRPEIQARLFKYFNKVYTSEDILIFRRISDD